MALSLITEEGITRVKALVVLSNGSEEYVEIPVFNHDPQDNTKNEQLVRDTFNRPQYDNEGNEITSDVTIVEIREVE